MHRVTLHFFKLYPLSEIRLISTTCRDVSMLLEEAVITLKHLEIMRRETVVDYFVFTIPAGEYKTGLTNI